jgi:1,2-diacylglycerol 3-beta-galactosyltransferase
VLGNVDVLFAISDTGGGHRSAAVALRDALNEVSGNTVSSQIVDILRITGIPGIRDLPNLYDHLSTRWLHLYDLTFKLTNGVKLVDVLSRLAYIQARRNIYKVLQETQPRLVVVTHPLVHRLVCAACRTYNLPCRVVTVVTDLVSLHAAWAFPGVDLCLVPTDEAYRLMMRRGMKASSLKRTGFPVHPKFTSYEGSPKPARQELGLDPDRFTVLVTSGGVGSGNLGELVLELQKKLPDKQILVVTGKNKTVYEQLQASKTSEHVHIYGFVDNMDMLMAASDVVVTKAGPGTLMEALAMRRPALVTEAVGMQERGNIDFVLNYELGAFCPTPDRVVSAVHDLEDPQRYAATVQRLSDKVPRDGVYQITDYMLKQLAMVNTSQPVRKRRRMVVLRFQGWRLALYRSRKKQRASEKETLS